MAAKQMAGGDGGGGGGLPPNLAGMSKNQLYEIMSQMKTLIEQNQQQAREILIQNPVLTKALFQAQIMLGMVQPPQVIPKIQPSVLQHPQPSSQPSQQPASQTPRSFPSKVGGQEQPSSSQSQIPPRKQQQPQPAMPISSTSVSPVNIQSQPLPPHPVQPLQQPSPHMQQHLHLPSSHSAQPLQPPSSHSIQPMQPTSLHSIQPHQPPKGPQSMQTNLMPSQLSSQPPSMPSVPLHAASQPPPLQQPQLPTTSGQSFQPLQQPSQPPLQPPLPPQPRPLPAASFHHQYPPQMGPNVGFQSSVGPQHVQQQYHSAPKIPPPSMGSYAQGQLPVPNQPPLQTPYQGGGSHLGTDYSHQAGGPMQVDRGSSWMPGLSESPAQPPVLPPPLGPGQMGPGSQPSRPAAISPEMEKALLQQVMSLTQEQINLLPPEQRSQVLQLQQMLRQ